MTRTKVSQTPWTLKWPSSKAARVYKRGLNKARTRKAKMDILGIGHKTSTGWESECNCKVW